MSASRLITPAKQQALAESLSGRFPALLLEAERIAASVAAGIHGRKRSGPGEHFWQYRRVQAGDSANRIDWRASARTPHLLLREREWEAAQTALLWLDHSASFNWKSHRDLPTKAERGQLLLLALAGVLLRGGERVGLIGSPNPPTTGRSMLARLCHEVLQQGELTSALPQTGLYARHARLVIFGDFLDPIPELTQRLHALFALGLRGHLVQILDPAEEDLPWDGRIAFTGLEGEGRFLAPRAEKLRAAYQQRLADHRAALTQTVNRMGWTMSRHRTDHRPELALLALHQALGASDRGVSGS